MDRQTIFETLEAYRAQDDAAGERMVIIQGGAKGADALAAVFACVHGLQSVTFEADWGLHGRAAGPIRNRRMLADGAPDVVLAFRCEGRSAGTDDMVRRARAVLPADCVHVIPPAPTTV